MKPNDIKLVRLLRGNSKNINLSGCKFTFVPGQLARLDNVLHLELQNNQLSTLPISLSGLFKVSKKLN